MGRLDGKVSSIASAVDVSGAELVVDGDMIATSHVFSDWSLKRRGLHLSATERLS